MLSGIININEIYLVKQMEYDYRIVLSNHIAAMLAELGYPCLKLHFYQTKEDIELLFSQGFSTSKRKIKAACFIEEIQNVAKEQLKQYLLREYDDFLWSNYDNWILLNGYSSYYPLVKTTLPALLTDFTLKFIHGKLQSTHNPLVVI